MPPDVAAVVLETRYVQHYYRHRLRDDTGAMDVNGRLLIVQYSANQDGSAFSALLLADGLREAGWETHVAFGFEGAILERFAKAGHVVHVVPHKNWLRRPHLVRFLRDGIHEWRRAAAFEAVLDAVKPDLVYVNTVVSLAGAVAAGRQGIPCVWHLRELFADVGGEMQVPRLLKPAARAVIQHHASRLVANSEAVVRNVLGSRGAVRAVVVPNAVGSRFFNIVLTSEEARRTFALPEGGAIIGVPGTLRPMKGHPFFFEAVAPLVRERPDLVVAVTGSGQAKYLDDLQQQVQALGIAPNVHFLGSVADMSAFYRACDAVCIPSVAEPFGRTVIEAFAAGTPVVATAVGGIRETVDDGKTGLLVPYGDAPSLAAGLRRLLDDRTLRETLWTGARRKAEMIYHESLYKTRLCTLVAETLGISHTVLV